MKRIIALITVLVLALSLTACGGSGEKIDISNAKNLADLAGAKIAAQAGTFHADALPQIENVQSSTYPEFTDLLKDSLLEFKSPFRQLNRTNYSIIPYKKINGAIGACAHSVKETIIHGF